MSHYVVVLREAAWLGRARAMAWCRILAVVSAVGVVAAVLMSPHGLTGGKALGTDFLSYYAASSLAEAGDVAGPYIRAVHEAAQYAALPGVERGYYSFLYPPPFLLICWPLALLPYRWALAAWLLAGTVPLMLAVRRILPRGVSLLPALVYPAMLVDFGHGQNGLLSAALMAGFMVLGDRRPALAGACLGALIFKPQLGIAVPVVLLAARRWRALAGAAAGAAVLLGASWAVLGTGAWQAFFSASRVSPAILAQGGNGFEKMLSVFTSVRLMGGGVGLAWGLQVVVAACVLAVVAIQSARRPGALAEGAMLAAACLIVSPWSFDYDLVIAGLPLAWLLRRGLESGFLPWEKLVMLAAYLLPLVDRLVAGATHLPLAPVVLMAVFWAVRRRIAAVGIEATRGGARMVPAAAE